MADAEATPPAGPGSFPLRPLAPAAVRSLVSSVCASEGSPWTNTAHTVLSAMVQLPTLAGRSAVLDALGHCSLGRVQFVDDLTAPSSSGGAASTICSQLPSSACSSLARRVKVAFRYGSGKTAIMPMFQAPNPAEPGCDVVRLRRLLGVLIDGEFTFLPLLKETRARGWKAFEEFFHTAKTSRFSIPVAAAQVPLRLEPSILYAAALLTCALGAQAALNSLQYLWGDCS